MEIINIITMSETVLAALIGAVVGGIITIIGWIVTFWMQEKARQLEAERLFLRRQYEEFYAPLYGLVQRHISIDKLLKEREKLASNPSEKERVIRFFVDNYLLPIQDQIRTILEGKSYLMRNSIDCPPSFQQFLEFDAQGGVQYELWSETSLPGGVPTVSWPETLLEDVRRDRDIVGQHYQALLTRGTSKRFRPRPRQTTTRDRD